MLNAPSHGAAATLMAHYCPPASQLARLGMPSFSQLENVLIVESDGEYWFNTDTLEEKLGLKGLREEQVNVKLCTGHTHCPNCKVDLAPRVVLMPDQTYNHYGFYDYDVDGPRWQHTEFACKACRHGWGPFCEGPKLNNVAPPVMAAGVSQGNGNGNGDGYQNGIKMPRDGSAGQAAWTVCDEQYEIKTTGDWKTFRKIVIDIAVAQGQNEGNVGTELPRWARYHGYFTYGSPKT